MKRLSVVVVHGSFSDLYRQEFQTLIAQVKAQVNHPVLGAYLECTAVPLPGAIAHFLQSQPSLGAYPVQILPLFLLPGVHVREDIPGAIAHLKTQFPQVQFQLLDYLGKDGRLAPFLEPQFSADPTQRLLIAHGSRRSGANAEIENLAQALKAHTAYWATAPSLLQTLDQLSPTPGQSFSIVPYFLFSGKIPGAIAQQVETLAQTNPHLHFQLGRPFGTQPHCAQAIAEILQAVP
ncbi:sirohydrochlorin chelatase [Synechococcus moorigangaii CMS01]|nr:sirohydrochlorin chelatase [Synechococcus moorigangaii CMS01]